MFIFGTDQINRTEKSYGAYAQKPENWHEVPQQCVYSKACERRIEQQKNKPLNLQEYFCVSDNTGSFY